MFTTYQLGLWDLAHPPNPPDFLREGLWRWGRFQVPPDLESCFRVLNEDAVWLKGMLGDVRGILISSLFDVYIAYLWWWSIDFQFVRMRGSTANQRFLFVKTLSGRPIMFPMLAAAGREIYQIPWRTIQEWSASRIELLRSKVWRFLASHRPSTGVGNCPILGILDITLAIIDHIPNGWVMFNGDISHDPWSKLGPSFAKMMSLRSCEVAFTIPMNCCGTSIRPFDSGATDTGPGVFFTGSDQ